MEVPLVRSLLLLPLLAACIRVPDEEKPDTAVDTDTATGDTAPVPDADGDGVLATDGDCDDADATVYPGAPEVCDGLDNNCDEVVDEGLGSVYYRDADRDGFGDVAGGVDACAVPDGYVTDATDCNDRVSGVNPDAAEACNDVDDDCDGTVDDGVSTTWYTDLDGDGHGDPDAPVTACEEPEGVAANADDCDDADPAVSPDAVELCDGVDEDCDGAVDDAAADADAWYADADGDGFGAGAATYACEPALGEVLDATDCDDGATGINPGAVETCDDVDEDCDGAVDDGAGASVAWYVDGDGDGYGDPARVSYGCDAPVGSVSDGGDCDDADLGINPSVEEVWYDGTDSDCDGADDDDADGDGDVPLDLGGTDCDDTDPTRYGGVDCRPVVACTHPSTAALELNDPAATSDLVFDADCVAWMSSLISGTDYVYGYDASTGDTTVLTGTGTHNIGSLALDPVTGDIVVSYSNVGYLGYQSGSTLPVFTSGGLATGTNWTSSYLNQSASSIAMDDGGCIWVPNWASSGTLDCVSTSGGARTVATFAEYVESVALDADGGVYASAGATVYAVDTVAGVATAIYTFPDAVLDMVLDYQGDLYVETNGGELRLLEDGAAVDALFATLGGEGKLAIAPDGYLVRVRMDPVSASSYEEWALGD